MTADMLKCLQRKIRFFAKENG